MRLLVEWWEYIQMESIRHFRQQNTASRALYFQPDFARSDIEREMSLFSPQTSRRITILALERDHEIINVRVAKF